MKFGERLKKATKAATGGILAAVCTLAVAGCSLPPESSAPDSSGNSSTQAPSYTQSEWLKDVYRDYFPIGCIVSGGTMDKYDDLFPHFNSVTAENDMKWSRLEPKKGQWDYTVADSLAAWAKENGKRMRGHTLLWYKRVPEWAAQEATDKESALSLIDKHVKETVKHFGDDVYVWDVCNEALRNSVTQKQLEENDYMRTGKDVSGAETFDFYALCGVDYIKQAFLSAEEALREMGLEDEVELYYNDYSLNSPTKREACVRLVKELQQSGVPIDGVGMQAHYRLPSYEKDKEGFLKNFEDSVKAFTELGIDVQITELDIRVYESSSDPSAFDGLPLEIEEVQGEMFGAIFEICRRYATPWKEGAGQITGVTTWGVADDRTAQSTSEHREYPLIFGREHNKKRAYYDIIDF